MAGNVIKTAFRLKVFTTNRMRVRNVGVNFAMKYLWFSKLRKNI